nr:unnamed protein product [Digitaria exilis]
MMKQRIGGRWSSRRGEEAVRSRSYSISSSSTISGTLSTAYTSNCSRNSSGYLASAMHFDFELEPAPAWAAKAEEEQIKHIANLVREFSDRGGDARVPERWLTELGIGWVLHLPIPGVAASSAAGELGQTYEEYDAPSWIWALSQIVEIIVLTPLKQLPNNYYEKEEQAAPKFFQKAMLKMLPFVDWIVASSGMNMEPTYENLSTLLAVHGALSKAFPQIQLASDSSLGSSAQVFSRIHNNLVRLLAAKEVKAGDAIWSVMKQIRARILEPTDDNLAPEGSSDIHKATRNHSTRSTPWGLAGLWRACGDLVETDTDDVYEQIFLMPETIELGSPAARYGFVLMDDYALAVTRDALYTELWRACAGPLVAVPRPGDLVFYFPQGHIEQVEASMNQISGNQTRLFDLPSKLLCRVLNVELKVETDTDDVYAQIVLMPETIEEENEVVAGSCTAMTRPTAEAVKSFCKTLTPTDISSGGLCVPRRHANECLPPLDMSQSPPTQELVAKDLHGTEWRFRHIFRGQPKRHILDGDWSGFVSSKRLVAGDVVIFLRGQNGELRIGFRRAMRHGGVPSSVLSIQSIYFGILATAGHAIATKIIFSVYYKPR